MQSDDDMVNAVEQWLHDNPPLTNAALRAEIERLQTLVAAFNNGMPPITTKEAAAEITRLTEALRAAEEREKALRDGWVMVPEEPTWAMLEAARDGVILNPNMDALMKRGLRANWKAMIRAALKEQPHD